MNLQQLISELQERNRETYAEVVKGKSFIVEDIDQLTIDTAHAVALAVIGEIEKYLDRNGVLYADDYDNFLPTLKKDLNTLEEALQDNK